MTTSLDRPLKREITVGTTVYTLTISPEGLKIAEKGRRSGQELSWASIISGDASLAEDLRISVDASARE